MDKKRFAIALAILLALCVGGYFGYRYFFGNKQEVAKQQVVPPPQQQQQKQEEKKVDNKSSALGKKTGKQNTTASRGKGGKTGKTGKPAAGATTTKPAPPAAPPAPAVVAAKPAAPPAPQQVEAPKPSTAELLAKAAAEARKARCATAGKSAGLCNTVLKAIEECSMPSIIACATRDEVLLAMEGNRYGVAILPHLPWRERLNIAFRPYHRQEETLEAVLNDFAYRDVHNVVDRPIRIDAAMREMIKAAIEYFPEIFPDRAMRQRLIYTKPLMAAVDVTSPNGGYWLSNASTRTGCDDNSLFRTGGCVQNISTSSGAAKRVRVYRLERVSDWDRIWFQKCLDDFGNPELQYCRTLGLAKSTH